MIDDDEVEVHEITEQGKEDALAALDKADRSARYAKTLKALLVKHSPGTDPMLDALRGNIIPYALVNPGGRVERILRKRGFLDDPAIVGGYNFSEGSH